MPLLNKDSFPDRLAVSQIGGDDDCVAGGETIALTTGEYKLIWHKKDDARELYHLASDPEEKHDLAEQNQETSQELQSELQRLMHTPEEEPFRYKPKVRQVNFDEDVLRRLKTLGYLD